MVPTPPPGFLWANHVPPTSRTELSTWVLVSRVARQLVQTGTNQDDLDIFGMVRLDLVGTSQNCDRHTKTTWQSHFVSALSFVSERDTRGLCRGGCGARGKQAHLLGLPQVPPTLCCSPRRGP